MKKNKLFVNILCSELYQYIIDENCILLIIVYFVVMIGKTHTTSTGHLYFVSPFHRNRKPTEDKCIWNIHVKDEILCFEVSYKNTWHVNNKAWGILFNSINDFKTLGVNYQFNPLTIAKFVLDSSQWHGYPADINKRPNDRPLPQILDSWVANKIISKPYRARIQSGRI